MTSMIANVLIACWEIKVLTFAKYVVKVLIIWYHQVCNIFGICSQCTLDVRFAKPPSLDETELDCLD